MATENRDDLGITLGIEEEFFLVDPETRDLVVQPDRGILEACEKNRGPHKIVPELLSAQIETNTRVCDSLTELHAALVETRKAVIDAAAQYGASVMGASTHPFAAWQAQTITQKERYRNFATRFQDAVRSFIVGGMHIHAGFGDPDSRIRVMTALRRYLPLFNVLSASSPFSGGRETGFKSWRLNIVAALPRTGIPGPLNSMAEYDRILTDYRRMEFLQDGSELWWDIRPSHAFPTIEIRICDICPRIEDTMRIAAVFVSLIRWLSRLEREGSLPPDPPTEIIAENRWLAQRYGVLAFLGAEGGGREDIDDFTHRLVEDITPDARALGCESLVQGALSIIREGAGADRQIDLYRLRLLEGDSPRDALCAVVDLAVNETREGIE